MEEDNTLTIEFGSEALKHHFLAWFLDGGGDQQFTEEQNIACDWIPTANIILIEEFKDEQ